MNRVVLTRLPVILTALVLLLLVLSLFFLERQAGRKIEQTRSRVEEMKTDILVALIGSDIAPSLELLRSGLAELGDSQDFKAILSAYTYKSGGQFQFEMDASLILQDMRAVDHFLSSVYE